MSSKSSPAWNLDGGPSYFDFKAHRTHMAASTDCSGVSPGSDPPNHAERPPARPSTHVRATSYQQPDSLTKINVFPIAEALSGHVPRSQQKMRTLSANYSYLDVDVRRPGDDPIPHPGLRIASASNGNSDQSSVASLIRRSLDRSSESYGSDPIREGLPTKVSRPGHDWKRTQSGGVWFARTTPDSRREKSSESSNSTSHFFRSSNTRYIPPAIIKPLRPPIARSHESNGPTYHHDVKIEKAFTETPKPPAEQPMAPQRWPSARTKRLLAGPIDLARKLSLRSRAENAKRTAQDTKNVRSPAGLLTHSTALRRNQTNDVIHRVTSILNVIEASGSGSSAAPTSQATTIQALPRVMTDRSDEKRRMGSVVRRALTFNLETSAMPSTDHRTPEASVTSSLNEMRMGVVPTSTPDQTATYRIKRSKSAESVIFFKVDISIRGGTSYLPSEARRIHTPPLPGADMQGKRRGFFFDYNAPKTEGGEDESKAGVDELLARQRDNVNKVKHSRPLKGTSRNTTQTKNPSGRDWYELQLAQFDTDLDEDKEKRERDLRAPRSWHEFDEGEKYDQKPRVQVDFDIPEHLPNSPLCPVNERYWRFEMEKLKVGEERQRVCWMHGLRNERFGEFKLDGGEGA